LCVHGYKYNKVIITNEQCAGFNSLPAIVSQLVVIILCITWWICKLLNLLQTLKDSKNEICF